MRRILLAAALAVALAAGATTATAQGFSGAWNSSDEPPAIHDPEIDAGGVGEGRFVVMPQNEEQTFCRNHIPSWAVTFQDPSGSITEMIENHVDEGFCVGSATQTSTGTPDFTVTTEAGSFVSIVYFRFNHEVNEAPLLYMVTNSSGTVLAQGPYTQISGTYHIKSGSAEFESDCLDHHLVLYTEPGTGVVYCMYGETLYLPGWPAPAPPPTPEPAPSATPTNPTPATTPATTEPTAKPKYAPLTQTTAVKWVQVAVEFHFKYMSRPQSLRATHCKQRAAGRYRCEVSWRRGSYSFAGTVEVGSLNTNTGDYTYGLRVVRTDVQTHQRHTFTVAY